MNDRAAVKVDDNGDCGPAAFALGLFTEEMLEQQNQQKFEQAKYQDFINALAAALNVQNSWEAVRTALLQLRRANSKRFQEILAPIIREIIIEQIKNDQSQRHRIHKLEMLHIAYAEFVKAKEEKEQREEEKNDEDVHNATGGQVVVLDDNEVVVIPEDEEIEIRDDDTFVRHEGIQGKFAEFYQNESTEDDITDWWTIDGGYDEFVAELAEDKAWLDDSELSFGAEFFEVVLNVVKDNNPKPIPVYIACGKIPVAALEDDTIVDDEQRKNALDAKKEQLYKDNIVDIYIATDNEEAEETLTLLPVTSETIDKLEEMQVEDAQTFAAWCANYEHTAVNLQHKNKHYTPVEKTWAESVLDARVENLLKNEIVTVEIYDADQHVPYFKHPAHSVLFQPVNDETVNDETHFLVDIPKQVKLDEKLARELQSREERTAQPGQTVQKVLSTAAQVNADEELARALQLQFDEEDRKGPKFN